MRRFRYVVRMDHEHHMRGALAQAERGYAVGEMPFGCVLVDRFGQVVAAAHDLVRREGDPTCHCDVVAVRQASRVHGPDLSGCVLYTTAEPCPMCFGALWLAGVSRVVCAATMAEVREVAGELLHELWMPAEVANQFGGSRVDLVSGVMREESLALFERLAEDRGAGREKAGAGVIGTALGESLPGEADCRAGAQAG